MTIEDLARHMDRRFDETEKNTNRRFDENEKHTDKKIDEKIEDLARITKKGFDAVDRGFGENSREHSLLESGQEDIKLRLDSVAYRFEFVELQKRVARVEKKVGIS